MEESFKFRNHLCIVFELLQFDLYRDLKDRSLRGFKTVEQIKNIVCQITEGLNHFKEVGIVHCDLKPENVLYATEDRKEVKIVDLGSACGLKDPGFTYVCSRYYRAPEITLGGIKYSFPVDMWSLGCIIVEMYTGVPLFPAQSEQELLEFHNMFLGPHPLEMVEKSGNKKRFFVKESGSVYKLKPIPKSRL
jgi:serine/threonine protein kinase